jgi:hypothetical protein
MSFRMKILRREAKNLTKLCDRISKLQTTQPTEPPLHPDGSKRTLFTAYTAVEQLLQKRQLSCDQLSALDDRVMELLLPQWKRLDATDWDDELRAGIICEEVYPFIPSTPALEEAVCHITHACAGPGTKTELQAQFNIAFLACFHDAVMAAARAQFHAAGIL